MKIKLIIIGIIITFLISTNISLVSGLDEKSFNSNFHQTSKTAPSKSLLQISIDEEWNKSYGGALYDYGYSVQQTTDGGYILTGSYDDAINNDEIWLIKTDEYGNLLWDNIYGGSGFEEGKSVRQTNDGGYILVGSTFSIGDAGDIWLIKTDSSGNTLWSKTFGGSQEDRAIDVEQTPDGGYIILGSTSSFGDNNWLIKTNDAGDIIWDKTFGANQEAFDMKLTSDGGYIITGKIPVSGYSRNIWLTRLDNYGNMVWEKNYGGVYYDSGFSVKQSDDYGFIVTGFIRTDEHNIDVYVLKTDADGNIEWESIFGGNGLDAGWGVDQTYDGGYVVTGITESYGNGGDAWLIKTDAEGNKIWDKKLGGANYEHGFSVEQTMDAGFIITGFTGSYVNGGYDIWLVKTADFISPNASIEKPVYGQFYIGNQARFSLPWTVVIGGVMVEVAADDLETGIDRVEFYVDGILYDTKTVYPYQWYWDLSGFGRFDLKIIAYDYAGNRDEESIEVLKFF